MSLLYLGISGIGEKKLFFWPPIVWNTPTVWNKFLFDGAYSKLWWSTVIDPDRLALRKQF